MHIRRFLLIPVCTITLAAACSDDKSPAAPVVIAPGAPTAVVATIGNASVSLSFSPPASDGGAQVTTYVATCTTSGASVTGSFLSSPVVVTALVNGSTYSCAVAAGNSVGLGALSESVSVTPMSSE